MLHQDMGGSYLGDGQDRQLQVARHYYMQLTVQSFYLSRCRRLRFLPLATLRNGVEIVGLS